MKKEGLTAYPEHLGAALGADSLCSRLAVFHGNLFGVFHFALGFALDTVCFHDAPMRSGAKKIYWWGTSQSVRVSSSSQARVTFMGPRGDSPSSSMTTAIPAVAACLLRRNHVLVPALLSSSIRLSTPIADLDLTCSYIFSSAPAPVVLPMTLLPYRNSGEHFTMLFTASMILSGSSDGLTDASTFTSINDVTGGFLILPPPASRSL